MPRKAEGPMPLTPAERQARRRKQKAERTMAVEMENTRLRAVIRRIADMSPGAGGVGQIARDEMRLWKGAESDRPI